MTTTQSSRKIYDRAGNLVERVVRTPGHVVVQRRQSDGSWWNIRLMTYGQARSEGLYLWERDGR